MQNELKHTQNVINAVYKVATLYVFCVIDCPQDFCDKIHEMCERYEIYGALIIAKEGLNGTIAGSPENLNAVVEMLIKNPVLPEMELKYSYSDVNPFYRMRIQIKQEIVSFGIPSINPMVMKGKYVEPLDWNSLISDPEIILIDTRNSYEIEIGTFENAINPHTETFKDFPNFIENLEIKKNHKIAMFCTGGIRCEKASSYLLSKGFTEVYHLKGGILKYLEEIEENKSKWNGECYVFDQRISVIHGLEQGNYTLCRSCRHPLSVMDLNDSNYEEGVSCKFCYFRISDKKINSSKERNLQMKLAVENNNKHLGFKKKIYVSKN